MKKVRERKNGVIRIFISSVQKEFTDERRALLDFIQGDALLHRFCDVFLFEDAPASDKPPDGIYLDEVASCDIYLGIFGNRYGNIDAHGVSPIHREFQEATRLDKYRIVYIKGAEDSLREPKMQALINDASMVLNRKRFATTSELVSGVYASLVEYLAKRELIRFSPFDATFCRNATLDDLDDEKIVRFSGLARRGRNFPLSEETPPLEILTHLNLLDKGRPTHAAVLLFAKQPQRFLISSEVKCAHFHGTTVSKPIPSYQVYKGTVFDLVDQAKDFVLSKIDLWVGTRAESTQVPTAYEIPQEVVAEAIVNAVVHRDYTSNASVQVMLFKDRLEIWNPGTLPPTLTLEKLRGPHASIPANPLLAEPMYLTKYIERMGTGVQDMIARCHSAGLEEPIIRLDAGFWITTIRRKQITRASIKTQVEAQEAQEAQVEAQVKIPAWLIDIMSACAKREKSSKELLLLAGYSERTGNFKKGLQRIIEEGFIEPTIPDKPNSSKQKYRLTSKGKKYLELLNKE